MARELGAFVPARLGPKSAEIGRRFRAGGQWRGLGAGPFIEPFHSLLLLQPPFGSTELGMWLQWCVSLVLCISHLSGGLQRTKLAKARGGH